MRVKEITLGVATFALALVAMQSVASAQTTTVSPTTTVTPMTTKTPTPTGAVQGAAVTVPDAAPSTGFGGK